MKIVTQIKITIINDKSNKNLIMVLKENKLITNEIELDQCSYPYNGYVPISVRLIKDAVKYGWLKSKIISNIKGYSFTSESESLLRSSSGKLVILYIGGITISEIEAIRILQKKSYFKKIKITIVTTNIINHSQMTMKFLDYLNLLS